MSPPQNFADLLSQNLEPNLRQHLTKVYTCMTLTCAAAAIGSIVHLTNLWNAGLLSVVLNVATLVALFLIPQRSTNLKTRLCLLLASGALTGHVLGLLIEQVMVVNPAFVVTALLGTTVSFGCLSLSAILARRGRHLALGGVLSSVTCALVIVGIGNLFYHSWIVHKMSLYLGLAVICGMVLFDTQVVMEEYRLGNDDYVTHALKLFFNTVDIFRYLMIIFVSKSSNGQRRRNDDEEEEVL